MKVLKKLYPILPREKDAGMLILSVLFYFAVPMIVATLVTIILALTILLAPLAAIVFPLAVTYTVGGVIMAILAYTGYDFEAKSDAESKE